MALGNQYKNSKASPGSGVEMLYPRRRSSSKPDKQLRGKYLMVLRYASINGLVRLNQAQKCIIHTREQTGTRLVPMVFDATGSRFGDRSTGHCITQAMR